MRCTVGMLQLFDCCLEDLKTWRDYDIGWECLPLDNSQWKAGIFAVILASATLTECHRVAISGNPMCGLYVVEKGVLEDANLILALGRVKFHISSSLPCLKNNYMEGSGSATIK